MVQKTRSVARASKPVGSTSKARMWRRRESLMYRIRSSGEKHNPLGRTKSLTRPILRPPDLAPRYGSTLSHVARPACSAPSGWRPLYLGVQRMVGSPRLAPQRAATVSRPGIKPSQPPMWPAPWVGLTTASQRKTPHTVTCVARRWSPLMRGESWRSVVACCQRRVWCALFPSGLPPGSHALHRSGACCHRRGRSPLRPRG